MKTYLDRLWLWLKQRTGVTRKTAPSQRNAVIGTTPAPPHPVTSTPVASEPPTPTPPPPRGERTLIIGVDFGTSSTKVIWQDLSDNQFEVFRWFLAKRGVDAALLPSTLVIRNSVICFGVPETEVQEGDIRLSSIKLCVLCRNNANICSCGNSCVRQGMVHLPGADAPIPANVYASLLLAHVFRTVQAALQSRFPKDELVLLWNIGCPMDHLDEAHRRAEWEAMVGVAMQLNAQKANLNHTTVLQDVAARLKDFTVPSASERNFFVVPEGLAAVKAFLESPHAESKTYAIVDVGAGTTEVSFFFNGRILTEKGQPLRPSYLADSTEPVGGLQIDSELARAWNCNLEAARGRKQADGSRLPSLEAVRKICLQYARTCWEIVKGRKLIAANDKRFDLFIIGGGGRLRTLHEGLKCQDLPGSFLRESSRQLQPPRSLRDRMNIQQDYDFLANACGLASSLEWDYYPPHEVSPMAPGPVKTTKIDRDDYYPK